MRRVRSSLVALTMLVTASSVVLVDVPLGPLGSVGPVGLPTAHAATASGYTPVTPDRVMDTREGLGGPRMTAGSPRALTVAGRAGVPANGAIAVVLNVTATEPAGAGFVTVYPSGVDRPTASNLNVVAGQTVPNLVVVGLGGDGAVQLFSSTDVHLVVDVVGWYASGLVPLTPGRLMDTREGRGGVVLGPGETRVLQVAGREGVPVSGALAVALNVTAVDPTGAGFVTVWPSGDRPTASNLNFVPGRTVPNAVLVGLAADGTIRLFNSAGSTHLVVDVAGWFDAGVDPVVPHRLMDTREGLGGVVLGPGETRRLRVVGSGNVPADGVAAVALNVTATEPTADPFITVWPAGVDRPTASNLNVIAGQTVPNAVVVGVGVGGEIRLFNSAGSTHLIVDVTGWFPSPSTSDVAAPVISGLAVSGVTTTSATISWTTDEPATTQVDHGTTSAYGTTGTSTVLTTSHTRTITGLTPSTTYHYRVRSVDAAGNARTTADATFTTAAAPAGPLTFGSATAYTTGVHAHGVAVVNVTGSAAVDLVVANAGSNNVTVTPGLGGGAFASAPPPSYAVGSEPKAVMTGDLNGDGRLDLVTANQGTNNVSVLLANGSGGFAAAVSYAAALGAHEPVLADLDGDGDLDIAVVGWGGNSLHLLRNNGLNTATFTQVGTVGVGATPHSVVAFDADADGDLDLATADHGSASVTVVRNDGGLSFAVAATVTVGAGPHSIRAGDLSGDGRPDLVTANDGVDTVSVLRDTGSGIGYSVSSFPTGTTPKSVAVADLDADGDLDVITANINGNYPSPGPSDGDDVSILLGNGSGTLAAPTHLANPGTPFAVVAADVDADGRLDLVTANWHGGHAAVIRRS